MTKRPLTAPCPPWPGPFFPLGGFVFSLRSPLPSRLGEKPMMWWIVALLFLFLVLDVVVKSTAASEHRHVDPRRNH